MTGHMIGVTAALRMVAGLPPLEPWTDGKADRFCPPMPEEERERVGAAIKRAKEVLESAIQEGRVAVAGREVPHLGAHMGTAGPEVALTPARLRTARLRMGCLLGVEGQSGTYCALRLPEREVAALAELHGQPPQDVEAMKAARRATTHKARVAWMADRQRQEMHEHDRLLKRDDMVAQCKEATSGGINGLRKAYASLPPELRVQRGWRGS